MQMMLNDEIISTNSTSYIH